MIYLYSSAHYLRFVQDALDVMALPTGAIYRFRYGKNRRGPDAEPSTMTGERALVVFVDQPRESIAQGPITFYPLREARIKNAESEGSVLVVDFEVGRFVDWQETSAQGSDEQIKALSPD